MSTTLPTAPLHKPQLAFKLTTSMTLLSWQRYSRGNNPPALLLSAFTAYLPLSVALLLGGFVVCYIPAALSYYAAIQDCAWEICTDLAHPS